MKTATASPRPILLALVASLIFTPMGYGDAPLSKPAAATPLATTEQAIDQRLEGKFFFLRGFYQDDKIEFDTNGKIVGAPQKGSFALSGIEVRKVHATKKSIIIEADRIGLHFFGGLPYEDDSKPFERIKVSKKPIEITIDRLVIEPEKKKKKQKDVAKAAPKPATPAAGTTAAAPGTTPTTPSTTTTEAATSGVANPPDVTFDTPDTATAATAGKTDLTANAAPATVAKAPVDPVHHDPKESWMQLSKALDEIFAPGLDETVIATLPNIGRPISRPKKARARPSASITRCCGRAMASVRRSC